VIYLSREGTHSLKFRIKAWELHRKVSTKGSLFHLIEKTINFMKGEDVGILLATLEDIAAKVGPIAAVVVDTVSRVLPGADENLQKDMTMFIAGCDAVQQRFNCIVIGVHHTNKGGTMRGSTVLAGAGDFLLESRREKGAMVGVLFVEKVKDAADGQELPFKVTEVQVGGIVPQTSLVVDPVEGPVPQDNADSDWPDLSICRDILVAIDEQWRKLQPWCHASNSSRCAATNIMNRWNLKRSTAVDMLAKWTARGIIDEVELSSKTHVKGYRKLLGI
jgi:hypothetical protein